MRQSTNETLSEKALIELVKQSREQSTLLSEVANQNHSGGRSSYWLAGAALAALIAAVWVLQYLLTFAAGPNGISAYLDPRYTGPLLENVTGGNYSAQFYSVGTYAVEPLFIITARFILGFSFLWAPLSLLLMILNALVHSITR